MGNKNSSIKVTNCNLCPDEPIKEFNRRISEIISMKYAKEIVEEIIRKYEKTNHKSN